MKRFALLLTIISLVSATGCCCPFSRGYGYGAGYAPYSTPTYGAPAYGPACPGGACGTQVLPPGTYPQGYVDGTPTAAVYGYPIVTSIDPLPVW